MSIEKILTPIGDKEYSFTIEILHAEEEKTIYRAVPDEPDEWLAEVVPDYIEFDDEGTIQSGESFSSGRRREIADGIWRGIKEQIVNDHVPFNKPL
jgi:hypothetical protein